jgi:site-specific DNA-cytosine methylase
VVTLDIEARFNPDIIADLRTWHWAGLQPDLIWLSDPCTEFSRESMPWCKTGRAPDLSIVHAGLRVIREVQPRYWVRENVRGSTSWVRPFLGEPKGIHGPFFLWGNFPPLGKPRLQMRKKESYSSARQAERARIPAALSEALAIALESQAVFV